MKKHYVLSAPQYESTIFFVPSLAHIKKSHKQNLLIYDERLPRLQPAFRRFMRTFEFTYGVRAGEGLKDFDRFTVHAKNLSRMLDGISFRDLKIFAAGGGSVGDFVGFFASVYKRGTSFAQIPSTWLAAIDSAHGGKTALNLKNKKNQIGSFYPAREIWVVRDLLAGQPPERFQEARGELAKTALISGKNFGATSPAQLWKILPKVIAEKYKIVSLDMFETKGLRYFLNLGHTWGHVLELVGDVPHGKAVGLGLHFALRWSYRQKFMTRKTFEKLQLQLQRDYHIRDTRERLRPTAKAARELLAADKKLGAGAKMNFVFIRKPGRVFVAKVTLDEIVKEAAKQDWLK